jgi:hypothetical protein
MLLLLEVDSNYVGFSLLLVPTHLLKRRSVRRPQKRGIPDL